MSDMKKTGFLLKRINSFIIFTFPSITNVVRRCALQLLMSKQKTLDKQTLKEALQKETQKMWNYYVDSELEQIVQLSERLGLATSGNYRNFYLKDGRKYAHAINPITGYPVQKDILSATIIAHQCMLADAYATAFMTLGSRKARQL